MFNPKSTKRNIWKKKIRELQWLWDINWWSNTCVIGVTEEKEDDRTNIEEQLKFFQSGGETDLQIKKFNKS